MDWGKGKEPHMPYDIMKKPDGYHVVNTDTGEDKGASKTRGEAEAHMRALYANEPKQMSSPGMYAMGGRMAVDDTYTPRPITHAYRNGGYVPFDQVTVDPASDKRDGKVGLPATGSGATEPGLGAGIPETGTAKLSNTNDRQRKRSQEPARNSEMTFFKSGGVMDKVRTLRAKGKKPISFKPGGLHETLGVPQGDTIPAGMMAAARAGKKGPKAKKEANFAKNVLTGPK